MTIFAILSFQDTGNRFSPGGLVSNFLTKHAPRLYCYLETPRLLWANVVMDTLIAAQAQRLGATVITRNVREFGRVPGLKVENWQD